MNGGVESFPIGIAYQLVSGSVVFAVYMDMLVAIFSKLNLGCQFPGTWTIL